MRKRNGLFILLILIFLSLSGASISFAHEKISDSNVDYLSTGIGDEDGADAVDPKFNLKLVFATQGTGEYVADVSTTIENPKGEKIIETISAGPHFYVALPPGNYRITATFNGKVIRKAISTHGTKRQVSYFYWPDKD